MEKVAKCIDCNKIIYINLRASEKTCRCEDCKNKHIQYIYPNKFKNGVKTSTLNCNIFDIKCEDCYFKQHNICKSKSGIKYKLNTLSKYCDLIISDYDTTLQDYLNIKQSIQQMIDNGLSLVDIYSKLCGSSKRGNTIGDILQLKNRNLSEAVTNAFMRGKMNAKSSYHLTWNNKEVYLRSSYELEYAKKLDKQQINYEVEYLRIKYWDNEQQKYRQAIPDFYIPSSNTIVEVKSSWTYNKQNMKDKLDAYLNLGYKFILVYEHNEYTSLV